MCSTIPKKKMSKYCDIHTADQLQTAIKGIRSEIKAQEKVLSAKYDGLHEHYRPSNMVAGFLKKNSDYYNWADVSLRIVKALKSKVGGIRRPAKPEPDDEWLNDVPLGEDFQPEDTAAEQFAAVPDLEETEAEEKKSLGSELKDAARAFMSEVRGKVAKDDIV